jgi:uncharacterized protein YuzE
MNVTEKVIRRYQHTRKARDGVLRPETEEIKMRIKVDKGSDALYFRLDENRIVESEEVCPGVILDFDENNRVGALSFLGSLQERARKNSPFCSSRLHDISRSLTITGAIDSNSC